MFFVALTTLMCVRLLRPELEDSKKWMGEVALASFGIDFENEVAPQPARYDVRTQHAGLFGAGGHYIETRAQALEGIARFVSAERGHTR